MNPELIAQYVAQGNIQALETLFEVIVAQRDRAENLGRAAELHITDLHKQLNKAQSKAQSSAPELPTEPRRTPAPKPPTTPVAKRPAPAAADIDLGAL